MTDQRLLDLIDADGVPYWRMLGITVESAEAGHVRLRLPMRETLGTRRPDVMHGGAIASLIDAAAGAATASTRREDDDTWAGQATTDLNVTFLNAATGDVIAEGRVLRGGRSLVFVGVEVHDTDGGAVAVGRATYTIIRKR
ncbi:MAG: hotdog fold thioesterase [Dehalococcoidia bacterium]|nr:hotdog fold thioesterase [Dehalococcoidia bacterium]